MAVPTTVRGIRTTDLVSSSLIKRDVFEAIYNFKPYQTPVVQFFLANKMAKRQTGNPKFEVQEDVLFPYSTTVNAAYTGAGTTSVSLTVVDDIFKVGDIVRATSTNQNFRVTARTSATVIVVDNYSASTISNLAVGDTLLIVGTAFAEGSTAAQFLSTQSTFPYNYAQILKKVVHLSGTQSATVNYGGDDWTNQRMKSTEEFKLDFERMNIFGVRNLVSTSGANVWASSGLLDSAGMGISDTTQYVGSNFATEAEFFNTYCKNLFAKGSREKTLYCGADTLIGINDFQKIKQRTQVSEQEYGVDVTTIITPFGRLRLIWHPLLEASYANWGIGVDRDDYLKYAFLSNGTVNRDLQYQSDISTPGTDERKAQYLAQIGLHLAGGGQGIHRVIYPGA